MFSIFFRYRSVNVIINPVILEVLECKSEITKFLLVDTGTSFNDFVGDCGAGSEMGSVLGEATSSVAIGVDLSAVIKTNS